MTTPYPDDWSRTVTNTASQCPDLTGSYENHGLADDGDQIALSSILFTSSPNQTLMEDWVSHVTFDRRDDNNLVVKAWVGDKLLTERLLTASQLPCREGHLVYHNTEWYVGGMAPFFPAIVHSSIDHLISLAADGSLVMENKDFAMGAFVVIPLAVKSRWWYRFPPTSPNSP